MSEKRNLPRTSLWLVTALLVSGSLTAPFSHASGRSSLRAGRIVGEDRDTSLRVTAGSVLELEGMVQETKRQYYDVTDQQYKQARRESYDLNAFGMEEGYPTFGLSLEKVWKYFTFQLDAAFMSPHASTTAKRDYYIGVGKSINYGGRAYKNMKIPAGRPFEISVTGGFTELHGMVTPFSFGSPDRLLVTPWVDFGLFTFAGRYEIDAGPVTGADRYLYPPENFVIGGESSGYVGLALPEIGLGGEIRLGAERETNFVVQGRYGICRYKGGTAWLVSTKHREKDVDIDHTNLRLRCLLEVPLESGRTVSFGAQYELVDSDASITSKTASREEIIQRRERFDKEVDFKMASATALLGVTF